MKRAYLYPISDRDKHLGLYNPYTDDFISSVKKEVIVVNEQDGSNTGLFNLIKYIFKIDYIFLNWIENLPERKGGALQTKFLYFIFYLSRILNIRIIWTMHNKLSHSKDHYDQKERIFRFVLKHSDQVITHSNAGRSFGDTIVAGSSSRIKYMPHPVKDRRLKEGAGKKYDILIWGTIAPYKGIDKFLDFLHQENLQDKYRILIVGKINSPEYEESLKGFSSEMIEIQNKFIEDELLQELIAQSRIVLFTYSMDSILSSGVLMDSLGYGARIIGPHVGAFADLAEEGIISTFSDFPDMIVKINESLSEKNSQVQKEKLDRFLEENSWDRFADRLLKLLKDNRN